MDLRFFRAAALAAICVIVGTTGSKPLDLAVIVNSGSTNAAGFKIEVWSDGSASITMTSRGGTTSSAAKSFTAPSYKQFFADLEAARKGNAVTVPCMKSASFGTSTHITWQDWTSPDLDCPPKDALGEALVRDVQMIRDAAGVGKPPLKN